jgi:hypothetical protein
MPLGRSENARGVAALQFTRQNIVNSDTHVPMSFRL